MDNTVYYYTLYIYNVKYSDITIISYIYIIMKSHYTNSAFVYGFHGQNYIIITII